MAQKSLLQMLEELAGRVGSLEREKSEVDARMQVLEDERREVIARAQAHERGEKLAAMKIEDLGRENMQATITIQALERQVGELGAIIAQASAKVDEILKEGTAADTMPATSMSRERPGESSADPQKGLKERSRRIFDPTEYLAR